MSLRKPNPDKITPPVLSGSGAGLVLAVAVRSLIDRYVNPADRELWWNLAQAALFLAPLIGAWLGGLRAKRDVTPITPDATPRDQDGRELQPVDHRTEASGYPPTRAVRPGERMYPRTQPDDTPFP